MSQKNEVRGSTIIKSVAGVDSEAGSGSGGSGIDYILNGKAEVDTTGWITYDDAAATPVDGTGGTVTTTWTRSTSSPLRGVGSFLLTKDAANRQGEGASYDFTIDAADKGKVLQIGLDYSILSGTFADNDVSIWVYDVTNAVIVQPAPYLLKNHLLAAEKFGCEFQASSSSVAYRLLIHVASTSASAYVLKFDNISVGPQAKLYGSPITDWIAYTPIITTGSGTMTNYTATGFWRRDGDSIEVSGQISFSTTSGTWGDAIFSLPSGVTADTSKLTSITSLMNLGIGNALDTGSNAYDLTIALNSSTTLVAYLKVASGTYASIGNLAQNSPITFNTGDAIRWLAKLPITGWGASAIMSQDADTRVVAAILGATSATTTMTTPDTAYKIALDTASVDTHGQFDNVNDRWVCPTPGLYSAFGMISIAGSLSTERITTAIRKNGTTFVYTQSSGNVDGDSGVNVSGLVSLVAGDYLELWGSQDSAGARTTVAGAAGTFLHIHKLQGPAQIAASEKVVFQVSSTASYAFGNGSFTLVNYDSVADKDTHGGWQAGGNTDRYVIQIPGDYQVGALFETATFAAGAVNRTSALAVYKNGSVYKNVCQCRGFTTSSTPKAASGSVIVPNLIAGDIIDIRAYNDDAAVVGSASAANNYFWLKRI